MSATAGTALTNSNSTTDGSERAAHDNGDDNKATVAITGRANTTTTAKHTINTNVLSTATTTTTAAGMEQEQLNLNIK